MRQVVLLRGVNVGGRNRLTMAALTAILAGLGACNIRTLIQSGNAVFDAPGLIDGNTLSAAIEAHHGFAPHVIRLTREALDTVVDGCPYPAEAGGKSPHCFFLERAPDTLPDGELARLTALLAHDEDFQLAGSVFYLRAPGGIGKSRLAARAESLLRVRATARNWTTVLALRDLAAGNATGA